MHRIACLLSLLGLVSCGAATHAADRPNVLMFLVDDMGLMDSSAAFLTDARGNPNKHPLNDFYRTPNLEQLAGRGMRYSQFYANSVCSPTRVTIMTGQNAARHRTTQWISPFSRNAGPEGWNWQGLTRDHVTLPRLLQQAGYRTIHVGKGHFGPRHSDGAAIMPIGFDVNIGGSAVGRPDSYYGTKDFGAGGQRPVPHLEQYHGRDIYLTEALTIEMNKAITQAVEDDQPFFAYMSHYAVHAPFNPDPRFIEHYRDTNKSRKARAFATMIEGIDKSLGDILAHIERLGVAENTLVIFLGDNGSDAPLGDTHGYTSSAPLRGKKATHYEGGMRVPFVVAWAAPAPDAPVQKRLPIATGIVHDRFASICDLMPTILRLTEVQAPDGHVMDGHDLWPEFAGQRTDNPQKFLMHFPHKHRSSYFTVYRHENWKLIYHYHRSGEQRYELFDLDADPYETANVASERPEVLKRMVAAMRSELDAVDAVYPTAEDSDTVLKPN